VIRLGALAAVLVLAAGCRTVHENSVRTRLVQTRLSLSVVPRTLEQVDAALAALPPARPGWSCTTLCLVSAEVSAAGLRTWCLALWVDRGCLSARAEGEGTRFWARREGDVPAPLAAALWALLDPEAAAEARAAGADDLAGLTAEEEERLTPRWSFLAGARTAIVAGAISPTFSYGGQVGVRYWANYFLVPGAAVELEEFQSIPRRVLALAVQARVELTLWSDENERYLNLPGLSFLMGVAPVLAFGASPAVGGRAMIGLHVGHIGRLILPCFFEAGFQWLRLPDLEISGLRVALGVGF
jgi:hypothetical protein